jgi:hypothetical protein
MSTPCRTIGWAAYISLPGDTISVGPGIYNEHLTIDKRLTLIGQGAVIGQQ